MAVPKLDSRFNQDRIYQYGEYRVLQDAYGARGRKGASRKSVVLFPGRMQRPKVAIRWLPLKLGMGLGAIVIAAAILSLSFLRADMVRLAYAEQDYGAARVQQSIYEEQSNNLQTEGSIIAGGTSAIAAVADPFQRKFLVQTNIPNASGKTLFEELYPLSKEIIRFEP